MSNTSKTQPSRRSRKWLPALLTGMVGAALAATMAGPVPSASAMIRSDQAGGPGDAFFADQNWNPTPALQAHRDGNVFTLSTGGMIVTPDPTAEPGAQTVDVTYYLLKRDAKGVYRIVSTKQTRNIPLSYQGQNVPQSFAGSGPLATVERGTYSSYQIRVAVDWYVKYEWQSVVHLRPNLARELTCGNVSGCTVYEPGDGPASLNFR